MNFNEEEYRKRRVVLGQGVRLYGDIEFGEDVVVGDYSIIGYGFDQAPHGPTVIARGVRIGAYALIHAGCCIGEHVEVEPYCSIGPGSRIGAGCRLLYRCQIHKDVTVGVNSIIGGFLCDRAVIGRDCRMFGALLHRALPPWLGWDKKVESAPRVADGVFIGMGAHLIGDIEIGRGSYVAAGAIVTRSVAAGMLVKDMNYVTPIPDPWTYS